MTPWRRLTVSTRSSPARHSQIVHAPAMRGIATLGCSPPRRDKPSFALHHPIRGVVLDECSLSSITAALTRHRKERFSQRVRGRVAASIGVLQAGRPPDRLASGVEWAIRSLPTRPQVRRSNSLVPSRSTTGCGVVACLRTYREAEGASMRSRNGLPALPGTRSTRAGERLPTERVLRTTHRAPSLSAAENGAVVRDLRCRTTRTQSRFR